MQYSKQAEDHIRLLRNLTIQTKIIDKLDNLTAEEKEYISFLREKVVLALVALQH